MKEKNLHKNKSGFTVPKDYFDSFENKLSEKLSLNIEKEGLTNNSDTGFKVPEDYFDTFQDSIIQKANPKESKGKVVSLITRKNLLYFSGIAAMIAIVISLSINKESELNFDDIEIADIHTYFSEGNIELSSSEMFALLGEETDYVETFENELISDEVLLDYLSEEDLEGEIIFTE